MGRLKRNDEVCENCAFWSILNECHWGPKTPVVLGPGVVKWVWPPTDARGWCGRFKRKEEE